MTTNKMNFESQMPAEDDEALEIKFNSLTKEEREVMKATASGLNEAAAGSLLGVSPKTISTHKFNLSKKLGLHNIADLARIWGKFGGKEDPLKEEDSATLP